MQNRNALEIIRIHSDLFELRSNGELIKTYTRLSSAKRGLDRLAEKVGADRPADGEAAAAQADGRAAQTPPASNTGGQNGASVKTAVSKRTTRFLMVDGKLKEIPLRRGIATSAHIDTLTFTVTKEVFIDPKLPVDDDHPENIHALASAISQTLQSVFGFGLSEQKNGLNGYKYSFRMSGENAVYGTAAFGGARQNDSIMIHLYGDGLTAAKDGWEHALYNWITVFAPFAKITRCDLAHDFVNGEYTPDQAKSDWQQGLFTQKHTRPRSRDYGYDWNDELYPELDETGSPKPYNRSGKTFYVGTPQSSRMVRVYEKGCELGDKTSPWVRFELQLRNRDYIIPHEIIIAPGEYLTGAYPVCQNLFARFQEDLSKAERISKTEIITLEHLLYYASQAASPCINALKGLGFDNHEIITLLQGGKFKLPKRLGTDKENYGNIALLGMVARRGLIDGAQAEAAAQAYRRYRRLQHRQKLHDTAPADPELPEHYTAVRRLWQQVFGAEAA